MATEVKDKPTTSVRGEQLALTNAATALGMPSHDAYGTPCTGVVLYCPTSDFRYQLCPRIAACLLTADDGVTFTDATRAVSDRVAATVLTLSSMNTAAQGDYVLVGAKVPFGGIVVDLTSSVNGTASALAATYVKGDGTFAALTATDGTSSGGATFGADGAITWTMPSDWTLKTINGLEAYWVQLAVSAQLDSSTTVAELALLSADTNRGYGLAASPVRLPLSNLQTGAVEAVLASGTATLDITWVFGSMIAV